MVYGAWLLLLALLTLLFSRWLDLRHNPNRELQAVQDAQGQTAVVLKRNSAGHYVASGLIDGEPVVFLLDTGATDVALSSTLADRLGLRRGLSVTSMTANGSVTGWMTTLDLVQLGPIRLHKVRALIMPSMGDDEVLLGMSFLKHLQWSQRGGELVLSMPEA